MGKMPESKITEIIERAKATSFEVQRLAVTLSNEAVGGNPWKDRDVETVREINQKLQLLQVILLGQTTGANFGLQG